MALIHHPTALETGFSEDDRARLRGIEQSAATPGRTRDRHQRADRRAVGRRVRRASRSASPW
jgi:hypothetical protein